MHRRKHRLSAQALACWIIASICALAAYFVPNWIAVIAEAEARHLTYQSQADIAEQVIGASVAYLAAIGLFAGLTVCFAAAGRRAQKNLNAQIMRQRSADTHRDVLLAIREGRAPPPFFLYLRPFYADELLVENPRAGSIPFLPSHYYEPAVSWESVFAERVEAFGRFVSLGTTSDSLSADRIESDESTWMNDFVLLASFANCIFVWPSTRPGTRWEINWLLRKDLARKSVFVIADGYDEFAELCGDTWDYVRAFLLKLGFAPPTERGCLFTADNRMALHRRLRLSRWRAHTTLREIINVVGERDLTRGWDLWRAAQTELQDATNQWQLDELDLVLPCVICGSALETIVCSVCEQAAGTQTADDQDIEVVAPYNDSARPVFNALGQVHLWSISQAATAEPSVQ